MITIPIRLNPTKLLQTANCCGLAENLAHARVVVVALAILAHVREVPLVLVLHAAGLADLPGRRGINDVLRVRSLEEHADDDMPMVTQRRVHQRVAVAVDLRRHLCEGGWARVNRVDPRLVQLFRLCARIADDAKSVLTGPIRGRDLTRTRASCARQRRFAASFAPYFDRGPGDDPSLVVSPSPPFLNGCPRSNLWRASAISSHGNVFYGRA